MYQLQHINEKSRLQISALNTSKSELLQDVKVVDRVKLSKC